MPRGIIKSYDEKRAFGFIESDAGDVFFHRESVDHEDLAKLRAGLEVTYAAAVSERGLRATTVSCAPPYTMLTLPRECSHRYVVRRYDIEETRVFNEARAALDWIREDG